MSTFIVRLNQGAQGALDKDPSTMTAGNLGTPMTVSRQRQVYVMGPRKINRLLKDGDTFTDCNYWKKFAYPQCSLENAIVAFAPNGDDGSTYVEGGAAGTVPIVVTDTITAGATTCTIDFILGTKTSAAGVTTSLGTSGSAATFCQIENLAADSDTANPITVQLNGSQATFTLTGGTSQIFNAGDLAVTKLVLTAPSGTTAWIQVIAAVASECNS
jgi:hypothetical protein